MRFQFQRGKRPSEDLRLFIDFANDVAKVQADTLASVVVKAYDETGLDVTASTTRSPQLDGTISYINFYGGTAGKQYVINMKATTSGGQKYEHDIEVDVSDVA